MGGIIGSGIFINPYVVARQISSPVLILGVWALGGLVALAAAFIWAELAAIRPDVGGQYAYLRDAYHHIELTGVTLSDQIIAVIALGVLTAINCRSLPFFMVGRCCS